MSLLDDHQTPTLLSPHQSAAATIHTVQVRADWLAGSQHQFTYYQPARPGWGLLVFWRIPWAVSLTPSPIDKKTEVHFRFWEKVTLTGLDFDPM